MEGPSGNVSGEYAPLVTVLKLYHARTCGKVDTTPKDGKVQPVNGDETANTGHGDSSDGG